MDDLQRIRRQIDAVDDQLLAAISKRAGLAKAIAAWKAAHNRPGDHFRPGREAEVLRRIVAQNPGPLADDAVARVMRELMSACLALESPLKVAYLGPEGTFTEAAMYAFFGHAIEGVPATDVDQVFRDVEADRAMYGIVPVENSTEGIVTRTLDRLARTPLFICGEIVTPIHHHLMAKEPLEAIREVHAHPQTLAQCRAWLDENLPTAARVPRPSNTAAARELASGHAVIGSRAAVEHYGLEVLAGSIEDEPDNATRFLVVGRKAAEPTGDDKTSMLVASPDRPGALLELLAPFAEAGVNLNRIESRPSRRSAWSYHFFIDAEGHQEDAALKDVIARLVAASPMVRVLGSFPRYGPPKQTEVH